MKHFYNLINKAIENISVGNDVLSQIREEYFDTHETIKEKFTHNTETGLTLYYDVCIEKGKPCKWEVKDEYGTLLEKADDLDNGKYAISFIRDNYVFKKMVFTYNHVLNSLEYYLDPNSGTPFCIYEPRISKLGLCLVMMRQGMPDQVVLYPVEDVEDEYTKEKLQERFEDNCVIAYTDEGIQTFMTEFQLSRYRETLDIIAKDKIEDAKPVSYIEESPLADLLSAKDFNVKRNLATGIDIRFAKEFVDDDELEENIVEVEEMEDVPDKVIESENNELKYFGGLDSESKRSGYGRTSLSNGRTVYEGQYYNDMRHGNGSYYYKDGSLCYYGDWKNNSRDGVGVGVSSVNQSIHVGKWADNRPVGDGVRISKDGKIQFIDKVLSDNTKIKITFKNDGGLFITKMDENGNLISVKGYNNY